MEPSNISKQSQQTIQNIETEQFSFCYQTNRKENQEAHAAKEHNHSQSSNPNKNSK